MFSSRKTGSASNNYLLQRSLRFRSSASAYLNRTPASAGNQQKWTWSGWVKRGAIDASFQRLFSAKDAANDDSDAIRFNNSETFSFLFRTTPNLSITGNLTTTQVFRDPSAWYHIVAVLDTTDATSSNRMKLYINGSQVTAFSTATYPAQNASGYINSTNLHTIGNNAASLAQNFDGYLTEVNFIDGQALTPSSFGSTNAATGVWQPIKYTGTYGTNGFYLPFTNTTSTSTLGNDFSGNGNTWTVNNISLTAGTTYDSMTDVPTNTNSNTANYAVINPLQNGGLTITNGNLTWAGAGSSTKCATASIAMTSGKWYFEALITGSSGGNWYAGVCNLSPTLTSAPSTTATGWGLVTGGGGTVLYKSNNNVLTSLSSSSVTGSVVSFAIDVDAGKIWFAQNGTWLEGSPSAGTGASYTNLTGTQVPYVAGYDSNDQGSINFGQRPFAYTPPSGYVALNTFNLPTPTIGASSASQANKYFDATTFTGNASTNVITNSGSMQPDMVWLKSRSNANNHTLYDALRGVNTLLYPNLTNAEATGTGQLTSFNSNGFTLGANENANDTNGESSVGWQWRASNATGVSNTSGSITSTVSANTTAGFSIATFTTPGGYSTGTVGHGLGVTPSMIIVKNRTAPSGANNWNTFHTSIGNTGALYLNSTAATTTSSAFWNNTSPTSSVFTIGSNLYASTDYVAYCFAQVAGYSAFGSYTGNGSADGPFVFLGFRPRYVMWRRTDTASGNGWYVLDSARSTYNVMGERLYPNLSAAGGVDTQVDFLSNGFKLRTTDTDSNANGGTYIYMAFAESPFKYANAR